LVENIIIFDESISLEKIEAEIFNQIETKIVSVDFESNNTLYKSNIIHEKIENYLDELDNQSINDSSHSSSLNWYDEPEIRELLKFNDLNLGWLIEHELFLYLLKNFKIFLGLIKLIEHEKPKSITVSSHLLSVIKIIDNENKINLSSFPKQIKKNNSLDKISFPVSLGKKSFNISIPYDKAIKVVKMTDSFITNFFNLKLNLSKNIKEEYILFLDLNPVPYADLLKELSDKNKNIIILNHFGTISWNKSQLDILRNTNTKILQLKDLHNNKIDKNIEKHKKDFQDKFNKILESKVFDKLFLIHNTSFWPAVKDEFLTIFLTKLYKMIEIFELTNELFSKIQIESILLLYNILPENRTIIHVANKKNISCTKLQHGLPADGSIEEIFFPFEYSKHQLKLKHAYWHDNFKTYYESLGLDSNRSLVVGSPRYDNLFKLKNTYKNTNNILLISSFLQNISTMSGYNSNYSDKHKKIFTEICKITNNIKNKNLHLKLHPSMKPIYDVNSILEKINPSIPIYRTQNITNLLQNCDVLISMDHSTVLLESMILGKPTITFSIDSEWYDSDSIITSGATLRVDSLETFEASLKKILFDSNFRNDLIKRGNEYVNNNLTHKGTSSKFFSEYFT